jgi:TolB-like protein/Flp pilus assembly protein TadD/tRNA A-37 threonylcarbamoyl transferase component Bud32
MGTKCPKCQFENPDDTLFCGKCGTQLPSPEKAPVTKTLEIPKEELTTGSTFAGRYQIIEELGKGGMGRVYKAHDIKINEKIALKLIKPEIAEDKKTIERFSNELKLARRIRHKNVCGMFDLGEEKGTHYITMEFIPGEDLKSLIRRIGQLPIGKSISIAKQICEGLAEAHRSGVVHRDLKSNNIMIDKEGYARIMDFGIARSLDAKGITDAGVMIGTPEYMSPEQVEGKEVDQRSDIYSLGVILYEMVTGRVPFEGKTPFTIGMKHKGETPQNPKELNTQILDDLNHVILRCLEKEKSKRYQSTEELRSDLGNIEKGMPATEVTVPAEKPMTSKEVTVTFKKNWLWASVLFAVVILIGIGILLLRREKPVMPAEEHQMLVVLPFENLGPPGDEYFADGITEEITSRLAAFWELGVISRSSAIRYKKTEKTIKEIGVELGVDFVLEGTVRWDRSPEDRGRVRVTPQLIRVADDTHLWSDRYDREIKDIFTVQSDIAEQVIRQIDITLLKSFQSSQKVQPTKNLEAYDLYLRGLKELGSEPLEPEYRDAIRTFEQAVAFDPEFALAYTKLSHCHSRMYHHGYDRTETRKKKAFELSMKALEIEPELAEAHISLAQYYYFCNKDYDKALEEFSVVERILPGDERVLMFVGYILRRQGHFDESLAKLKKALQLNPVNIELNNNIAWLLLFLRDYEEADNYYRRSLSLAPDNQVAYQELAFYSLLWKADLDESKKIIEKMPKDENPQSLWYWIELDIIERNYQKALDRLDSTSLKTVAYQSVYKPIEQYIGQIYFLMNEPKLSRINYDTARIHLEEKIREQPDDSRIHSSLGIVYAMLGRKEDALREGKLGVDLYPISKDALVGPSRIEDLAQIYTILGMFDEAINHLDHLLSTPCLLSESLLKLHPKWDPLRDHPGFKQLIEEYSDQEE